MADALQSMTGYARAAGNTAGFRFVIEFKSVNARGLDIRARITPGYDALEPEIRRRIGKAVTRGSVTLNLNIDREGEGCRVIVNRQALGAVLAALHELDDALPGIGRPTGDGILALKGVLEQHDAPLDPDADERLQAAVYAAAEAALAELVAARRGEGAELGRILLAEVDEIGRLRDLAAAHPGRNRDVVLARLKEQAAELMASAAGFSEERLAQEALLLATKADIREELDRLAAHVSSARAMLREGGAIGRKLDFLSQEFNREANTLCSKSNAVDLTAIGLDLKAVIDQFREQVQNLE